MRHLYDRTDMDYDDDDYPGSQDGAGHEDEDLEGEQDPYLDAEYYDDAEYESDGDPFPWSDSA